MLIGLGLLVLLAIVAFAARSGLGHSGKASPTPGYLNYAFTLFLIVFVLAIPIAIYAFLLQAREGVIVQKSFTARVIQNILTFAFFFGVAVIVFYVRQHRGGFFHVNTNGLKGVKNGAHSGKHGATAPYNPKFEWVEFWVAAVLVVGGGAAWLVQQRRLKRRTSVPFELETTVADDFVASIGDAIDDLEAEPDPRRAVIAAYARMEGVLARNGLRRRPSETPLEYLRRILLGLSVRGDSVTRLTRLFEQAKFSRREIDLSMKLDAIAALRAIRDDLQAVA